MLKKKAQESRNDLLVWYVVCIAVVVISVGALYGFGIIGATGSHGPLIESKITAAAVVEEPKDDNTTLAVNSSLNSTEG